jgi:hypothetical protein
LSVVVNIVRLNIALAAVMGDASIHHNFVATVTELRRIVLGKARGMRAMNAPKSTAISAHCAVLLFLLLHLHQATARQTSAPAANSGPFQPQLLENDNPLCPAFLADTRRQYQTPEDLSSRNVTIAGLLQIGHPFGSSPEVDPNFKADDSDARHYTVSLNDGSKVFLHFVNIGGCGGACESELIAVSGKSDFEDSLDDSADKAADSVITPRAPEWIAYRDAKGNYYVVADTDGFVEVYRITKPRKPWHAACRIAVQPDESSLTTMTSARAPMQSLMAMEDAADTVAGGGGDACGTMQTSGRWEALRKQALVQTLYRPWALHNGDYVPPELRDRDLAAPKSENSYGDYGRIEPQLQQWSLGGIGEHRAFERFRIQHDATAQVLAGYYQKVFGWDARRAESSAVEALDNALAQGFGFYDYNPYPASGEAQLRQTLLEHRPMAEVRAIQFDAGALDRIDGAHDGEQSDSVLNAAIEYPEALRYLIDRGLNPNLANPFGKTPLMYAAQHNQLESVRILLDAGVNVNAATVAPVDRCSYALRNTHVTALHYAVRNASADIVRLLLSRGAATFMRARVDGTEADYPLDWLLRYAPGSNSAEINQNLTLADIPSLQQSLQLPSPQERSRIARELTLKAESSYATGKVQAALGTLEAALAADPDNDRALTDLPLVALRAGSNGMSLAAAARIIATLKTPAARAAAWFNTGLACDQAKRSIVQYDGANYCSGDFTEPYLRSWQEQATAARAERVRETLRRTRSFGNPPRLESCAIGSVSAPEGLLQSYIMLGPQLLRLYLWERSGTQAGPTAVELTKSGTNSTPVTPKVASRIELGGDTVTVMETPWTGTGPAGLRVTVKGQPCHLY